MFPKKKTEYLISIVKELGKTVSCEIKDENIIRISRAVKKNPENARPRSIIVEFNNINKRDQFLASTISYNRSNPSDKLNASHVGCNGSKLPIYVTEHLSPFNKSLHAAARQVAKEKGYKFVWIRNGRIFVRRNEQDRYIVIRDMSILGNLK